MTDEYQPPSSAELKARYIKAADKGDWNHCRMICNTAGCGLGSTNPKIEGLTLEERIEWRKMFELACSTGRDKEWPKLRATLV